MPTRKFHIIQPVVVKKNARSPGRSPWWKLSPLSCSSRMPPCPCTIALGSPVVPEENSTHSGWSKGTCSHRNSSAGTVGPSITVRPAHALDVETEDRHVHDLPQARQRRDELGDLAAPVEVLASVPVAVGREEDHRVQLAEPVQRAPEPEVG